MNLTGKAVTGMAWVGFFSILTKLVRFITVLILARLLEPNDFGVVSIGLIVVNGIGLLTDLGMGSALIFNKKNVEKAANTSFFLFSLMGILLTIFAYFIHHSLFIITHFFRISIFERLFPNTIALLSRRT